MGYYCFLRRALHMPWLIIPGMNSFLSYDVASGTVSDIAPCIKIVNPLVVYIFW